MTSGRATDVDVAVVGGGLAGLTAALILGRAGRRVALFEKAPEAGGRAGTLTRDGFAFNVGPHAIYRAGAAARLLGRLGVTLDGGRPDVGAGQAVCRGALHPLPITPAALLATPLLGLRGKLRLAKLFASLPRLDPAPLDGTSVAAWLEALRLPDDARALVLAFVRLTTYADAPERLDAGATVRNLNLGGAGVLYLHGGWRTLVDDLAARARQAGVVLHARAPVAAVERETGGRASGVRLSDGTRVGARSVIVTAAPEQAARLVEGADDTPLARWAATRVPVRAACLDVALRRLPRPRATFALGIDRPTYFSVHSAVARLAPEGGALIHVARYLAPEAAAGDAATERELHGLLDLMQPEWRKELVHERFLPDLVVTHALPAAAERGLRGRPGPEVPGAPGLYLAGDWVGPEGLLIDASLSSAARAVDFALAECAHAAVA
jgi:phytoene dehydrogenase-like protein